VSAVAEPLGKPNLIAELQKLAGTLGLTVQENAQQDLSGELESIRAKWWFGGRKATYRMSCRLSEPDHTAHFREAVTERSWGIPPPTLTVEKTTQTGWQLSGERHDVSLGGAGSIDYAKARNALQQTITAAGWQFQLEVGRMP
jgi:hypothetical protein